MTSSDGKTRTNLSSMELISTLQELSGQSLEAMKFNRAVNSLDPDEMDRLVHGLEQLISFSPLGMRCRLLLYLARLLLPLCASTPAEKEALLYRWSAISQALARLQRSKRQPVSGDA